MSLKDLSKIKAVVIMLDGCVLDLNHYRYNYYKNMCNEYNITLTKEEFYSHLGNMYDMYDHLPLANKYNNIELNEKIENELYDYLNYKGLYAKEGFFEVLNYFHQKNISITILSTHTTKNAIKYLKAIHCYSMVDYILGSDTKIKPLPSKQMLQAVSIQFDLSYNEMLVISPIYSLNKVAHSLKIPVYYFKDLVEPSFLEKETSVKTVYSFFDVLNSFMFDHLYNADMYSQILGMDKIKDESSLNEVNKHLKDVYKDDPEILNIVENTYEYHLSQLTGNTQENTIVIQKEAIDSYFEDRDVVNETKEEKQMLTDLIAKQSSLSIDEQTSQELTATWNKILNKENIEEEPQEEDLEVEEKNDSFHPSLYLISEFFYSFVLSFLFMVLAIIIAIIYTDYIDSFKLPYTIFSYYQRFINIFINHISIQSISQTGLSLIFMFIFHGLIIYFIKIMYYMFNKDKVIEKMKNA
jgi:beta-phosphoglucomutase-like phosphatase (HAD superfamily)